MEQIRLKLNSRHHAKSQSNVQEKISFDLLSHVLLKFLHCSPILTQIIIPDPLQMHVT
jgi:hypothetical protein